ncbi:MAG: hypothetical protein P4L90_00535 [Rhodopila sp.]|nr:hypothetical protein [Rhodopila sp.]
MSNSIFLPDAVRAFFARSDLLDHYVLRPLSHIHANWELSWDLEAERYEHEHDSFAQKLNLLIESLALTRPPSQYHDGEDSLAQYVVARLNWNIRKNGHRWVGADYDAILEQGGHGDIDQKELTLAAAGRIHAALARGQMHFDDMEKSHAGMLGAVLAIILYHRADDPPHPRMADEDLE